MQYNGIYKMNKRLAKRRSANLIYLIGGALMIVGLVMMTKGSNLPVGSVWTLPLIAGGTLTTACSIISMILQNDRIKLIDQNWINLNPDPIPMTVDARARDNGFGRFETTLKPCS